MPFPKLPAFLARAISRMQTRGFRRGGGGKTRGGVPALLLHTTGARSGAQRTAMVGFLEEASGGWLIVASLGGAARHPAWLYNLAKQPRAAIEFGDGRRVDVMAEALAGAELEAAWGRFEAEAPEYVRYLSKTDRVMPILRLRAADAT